MQLPIDEIESLLKALSKGKEELLEEKVIAKLEYVQARGIERIDYLPAWDLYRQFRLIRYVNNTILKDSSKIDAIFRKKKESLNE